jgi:bifunctional non-homologous end joining protein LigD
MNTPFPVELLTEIGRENAEQLLKDNNFWLQKKLDGERRQFARTVDGELISYNRSGNYKTYPNPLNVAFERVPWRSFLMDGELIGDIFYAFDLLQVNGVVIAPKPYRTRYAELADLDCFENPGSLVRLAPTFLTTKAKTGWMAKYMEYRAEGVVFKRITAPYRADRAGQHFKYKFWKKAACIVTCVGRDGKATMDLAMANLNTNKIIPVGRCSTNGKKPTPQPGDIVEIKFLYAADRNEPRLYQPELLRPMPKLVPRDCSLDQLENAYKEGV